MKKISKYIEFITTKILQKFKEKKYESSNKVVLKYLLEVDTQSSNLVVVFSACTRKGIKARYNYVRTLNNIKINKLFILDDFGADHRGAYYLGKNMGNEIEIACKELITKYVEKLNIKKIILCGSSKGGAALNLMTDLKKSIAIIGAPQYLLGNYLMSPALKVCRDYVMGDVTDEKINNLNNYLRNKLRDEISGNHFIYFHYSDSEHTYEDHVKYLIDDLIQYNYKFKYECKHYIDHWDVSKYFPDFLLDSLNECCF